MIYRMVPFSMTLNDLLRMFQGPAIIPRWISQTGYKIDMVTTDH